jgi:class 3 adenylate cyclase/tetratricopeptide (TPR) repeat protein
LNAVTNKVTHFFKEVWRRNVLHVAIPYGIGSWLVIQIADVILGAFETPPWVFRTLLITLAAGFPIAIIVAWVFDIGPKGLVRTSDDNSNPSDAEMPAEEPEPAPAISLELGDSERRRVTMLGCVLHIHSVEDDELDPEELADLLSGIEKISQAIASQYEGYRLPGQPQEISIVFGYPHAHDDDARRAVAAGLATLDRVAEMVRPTVSDGEITVSTHAAVHSGLVVFDDSMTESEGTSIIGRVPGVTSWLQTIAPANSLVVSQQTQRLISSHFNSTDLGSHKQAQLAGELNVYRIENALKPDDESAVEDQESSQLVGREHELSLLEDRWENVIEGEGQFALVKGEAGIGKSAVVRAFLSYVKKSTQTWVVTWYCSPYEQSSDFYPLNQFLKDTWFRFERLDSDEQKLAKMVDAFSQQDVDLEEVIPLFANLLSVRLPVDCGYQLPSATSQVQRHRTMELITDVIRSAATRMPVFLMVDGIHWIDPSTLEILEMILNHGSVPGVFLLMTSRPELPTNWSNRSYIMEFDLHHLSRRASREIVIRTAADAELPEALIKRIVDETDGNPMFIEELTLAVLESNAWRDGQDLGGQDLAKIHIPATLQESLSARVDQLGSAKALLQVCSMLGRDFSYRLLLSVSETGNEMALLDELDRIVKAEFLFKRGSGAETKYAFKHFLIQETAYQSLLKSTRKKLHLRIGEILESEFPATARQRPQQLAHHFALGGNIDKAIKYWTKACRRSVLRSANLEAIEQARTGLKLLQKLPESTSRNAMEVPLQSTLGSALLASQGYTAKEVGEVFNRARVLAEGIDDPEQMFQVFVGLWMYYAIRAQYSQAMDIAAQLVKMANAGDNAGQQVQAHYSIGYTLFYRGEYQASRDEFEKAISCEVEGADYISQSASADDTRTHVRCLLALVCWHLGYPETALQHAQDADKMAHELEQPFAITFVAFHKGWLHQRRREAGSAAVCADECVSLAEKNGYRFFVLLGLFVQAWAANRPHHTGSITNDSGGSVKMQATMEMCKQAGINGGVTYMMFQLAEEFLQLGQLAEALEQLEQGLQHLEKYGEPYLEPEYYRLKGCVSLARFDAEENQSDLDEAIEFLTNALSRAKLKQAMALQLRAATDLAVALSHKGENTSAAETLENVINGFEEFDNSGDCARARDVLKKIKHS